MTSHNKEDSSGLCSILCGGAYGSRRRGAFDDGQPQRNNAMREIFFNSSRVLTYIIKRCYLKGYTISQAQAQRLLYCSYGCVMALFDMCLTDEKPITWEAGPIFPRALFDHMHHQLNFSDQQNPLEQEQCPPAILYVINQAVDNYARMSSTELTAFLTAPDTPWYIQSQNGENLGVIMDDKLIHDYFLQHVVNPSAYAGPTMEINIKLPERRDNFERMWD